jgi:hypothetical protein
MPKSMPKIELGTIINVLHYERKINGHSRIFHPTVIPSKIVQIEPIIIAVRIDGEVYPTTRATMPLLSENYGDLWHISDDLDNIDYDLCAATTGTGPTSVTQPVPEAWGLPHSPEVTRN